MENDIKRWNAKRKSALVMGIIQGKTTVAEASRSAFAGHEQKHCAADLPTHRLAGEKAA